MRKRFLCLAIALALTVPAVAQQTGQTDNTDCKAEEAALERDIRLARSKGQMLRGRETAEALAALQARCKTLVPEQSRTARIRHLEEDIRDLRLELEQAERQLRELRSEGF